MILYKHSPIQGYWVFYHEYSRETTRFRRQKDLFVAQKVYDLGLKRCLE